MMCKAMTFCSFNSNENLAASHRANISLVTSRLSYDKVHASKKPTLLVETNPMEQRPDLPGEEPYKHHNAFVVASPTPDKCGFLQKESPANSNQDILTCCR